MSAQTPALRLRLALVLVTVAAWGGVVLGVFQSDDFASVVRDPATADPILLGSRLLHGVRPLLRASYLLDHAVWGLRPGGFLLSNLVLHVMTVLGVFALARRRLDALGAFLAASVFSLQPANVEVVGWVSGRSTGLCTALLVASLWVNGEARWRAGPRAWGTALLLFGACLAKEVALVAPLFLLLWDRTRPDQEEPGALRPLAACGVMALAAGALALSERYRELLAHSLALRAPGRNLLESAQVIPTVLSAWVRPGWLALPHPPADAERWPVWLGAGMVLVLLLLASTLSRRAPLVALAAGWVVIALLPTHSLLAKTELVTAKPLYLAWVGPSLLLGGLASALVGRIRTERARRLLPAGLALILASAGALVWTEVAAWSDAVALGSRTVARNPRDAAAWNLLGAALQAAGRQREAVQAFRSASDLAPSSVRMRQHLSTAVLLCGDCSPEERRLP